jgi:hypothetical protein
MTVRVVLTWRLKRVTDPEHAGAEPREAPSESYRNLLTALRLAGEPDLSERFSS